MALAHSRQFAKALDDLDESLRRAEPWAVQVLIARGHSLLGLNQPARAIEAFSQAIEKEPRQRAARSGRGEAFAVQGKWKESEQDFQRAIDLDPFYFDDHDRRLVVLLAAGRLDEYRSSLAKMIKEFGQGEPGELTLDLAMACTRIPKAADSATLLRLALKSEKPADDPGCASRVGAALYRAGLFESAVTRLERSRKSGKPSAEDEFFLAMSYRALGRKDEAKSALARGLKLAEEDERKKALDWRQRLAREALRQEASALVR
jgi:tetratricopeptide (TPR) repeat protein